jgi:hypothetical protein
MMTITPVGFAMVIAVIAIAVVIAIRTMIRGDDAPGDAGA